MLNEAIREGALELVLHAFKKYLDDMMVSYHAMKVIEYIFIFASGK